MAMVVLLVGCGGGTKTVTQTAEPEASASSAKTDETEPSEGKVSLGGSEERADYPSVEAVGKAIVADIEERYGLSFESGECENFDPQGGGAPVYICEIKIDGEWHGNIQATIHPDGSFEWEDLSGAKEEFEGGELSVSE
jgi:hypothetical protein